MGKQKIREGKLFLPVIGSFFKRNRERCGLTQESVTLDLGISRSNITKYESGEIDMPTSKIPELCQLYQCKMSECGKVVDSEMEYTKIAKMATYSKMTPAQYMAFASDTPLVQVEEELLEEKEFTELIKAVGMFMHWEIRELDIPEESRERLERNFSFFIVEVIKLNERDKGRRDRLIKYCNTVLREHETEEIDS